MPEPCPDRPQVPEEEKLFVGIVKVHNTITVCIDEYDGITNDEDAKTFARSMLRNCDCDIHETEAFRDGE